MVLGDAISGKANRSWNRLIATRIENFTVHNVTTRRLWGLQNFAAANSGAAASMRRSCMQFN
jgi:hypothetical protein